MRLGTYALNLESVFAAYQEQTIVAQIPLRNRPIRQLSLGVTLGGTLIGAILAVAGIYLMVSPHEGWSAFAPLTSGLTLLVISLLAFVALEIAFSTEDSVSRIHQASRDLADITKRIEPLVKAISQNSQISDAAKSIAYRELEREALRQAIHDEMYSGDQEAVEYLINEMERRFGYKQEAQKLRKEMTQIREMTIEEKINDSVSHIEKLMVDLQWERARHESERLMKLFPRHERVKALPAEFNRRRATRKQELLARWKTAVEREEIDLGITILTELDQFITPEEAQALKDSVRHVFKARLLNLSVQFGLAVQENRWRDALETGLLIRQEYPNSRIAREVSDKLDTLRLRAGFIADADVISQRQREQKAE